MVVSGAAGNPEGALERAPDMPVAAVERGVTQGPHADLAECRQGRRSRLPHAGTLTCSCVYGGGLPAAPVSLRRRAIRRLGISCYSCGGSSFLLNPLYQGG